MKLSLVVLCCAAAIAHGALRASQDNVQSVKTITVSESDPAAEALEPSKDSWVKPAYGKVRAETGATGCADEEEEEEEVPKFKPSMVARGHFSGEPEEEEHEPVKPAMVGPGDLAEQRRAEMAAEKAKKDAIREEELVKRHHTLVEQQEFACRTIESTRQLALALHEKEDTDAAVSKKMVLNLVKAVCPALKMHANDAMKDVECAELQDNIAKYYNKKYEGPEGQTKEAMCNGAEVEIQNYAVAQALHSANNFFDVSFCPKTSPCAASTGATGAEEDAEAAADATSTEDLIQQADAAAAETEKVLESTDEE